MPEGAKNESLLPGIANGLLLLRGGPAPPGCLRVWPIPTKDRLGARISRPRESHSETTGAGGILPTAYDEFVGVDGCRGGWVAAAHTADGRLGYEVFSAFETVLTRHHQALILVDVPIGLRDSGQGERQCDREARRVLKGRGSSVFLAPVRAALYARDYASASSVNREKTGRRGLSRQSWAIAPKIREVNECLAERAGPLPRVREMHPELCFWALNGCEPLPSVDAQNRPLMDT